MGASVANVAGETSKADAFTNFIRFKTLKNYLNCPQETYLAVVVKRKVVQAVPVFAIETYTCGAAVAVLGSKPK